jgi:hypothetical protein
MDAGDQERVMATAKALNAQARQWVWAGTTWKTVAEAAKAAGVPIREVQDWIRDRRVIALQRDGVVLLPSYEFGADGMPLPVLATVMAEFNGMYDDMSVAAFFESRSSFLRGLRPREIVSSDPERVAAAAKFDTDTVKHP